jgi:hypothetical protein
MSKLKWEVLDEVSGRLEAEAIKSLLEAEGIPTELIQEAVGHLIYPVTVDGLGRVQVFVPKKQLKEARFWLKAYHEGLPEEEDL